jgi:hypothetical protein
VICNRNEANVCHLDDSQVETAAQNDEMFEEPHSIAAEQLAVALDALEREYRKLCEIYPPDRTAVSDGDVATTRSPQVTTPA